MLMAFASEPASCLTVSINTVLERAGELAGTLDKTAKRVVFSPLLLTKAVLNGNIWKNNCATVKEE